MPRDTGYALRMSHLAEKFFAMPEQKRRLVLLNLCRKALAVWEAQFPRGGTRFYKESVTGTTQLLDVELPREALQELFDSECSVDVQDRYREPIVALQNLDLELPGSAELAYYAIYNAHCRYRRDTPIDERLILNQALSCLPEAGADPAFMDALSNAG